MFKWLWIISVSVLLSWQTPAFAGSDGASTTTDIVTRIQDEGYMVTKITRTWLGRILVVAHNDKFLREVVVNRRSGDILRDSLFYLPGSNTRIARPVPNNNWQGFEDKGQSSSVGRTQGRSGNQATATGASQTAEQESAPSDNNTDTAGTTGTDTEAASTDAVGDIDATDSGNVGDTDTADTDAGDTDAADTDAGDTDAGDTDAGDTDAGDTDAGDTDAGDTDAGDTDAGDTDAGGDSSGDSTE
ncbi:MAG: hypothetical protein L3J36_01425 [Rhodobacteraceae bacterium]|nr:hypothetical protein [Paracoccaceae bacterium]